MRAAAVRWTTDAVIVPVHIGRRWLDCPPVARRGQQRQRAARARHAGDGWPRAAATAGKAPPASGARRRAHPDSARDRAPRALRAPLCASAGGSLRRRRCTAREVAPDAERAQQRPLPQHVRLRARAPNRQIAGDAVRPECRALQLLRCCIRRGGRKQQRRDRRHGVIEFRPVMPYCAASASPAQCRRRLRRQHERALRRRERIVLVRAHTERKAHAPRRVRRRVHRNAHLHISCAQPAGDRPLGAKSACRSHAAHSHVSGFPPRPSRRSSSALRRSTL